MAKSHSDLALPSAGPGETKLGRGAAEVKPQNDGSQAPDQVSSAVNGGGKHDMVVSVWQNFGFSFEEGRKVGISNWEHLCRQSSPQNIKDCFLSGTEGEHVAPEVSDCHVDSIRCQNTTTRGDGMDRPERDLKGGAAQNSPLALIGNG